MIEWGCGDGNQLGLLKVDEYCGCDVSQTAIDLCTKKYCMDTTKHFSVYNGEKTIIKRKSDMSMSLDVLYHIIEDEIFDNYMYNLFESASKYVCIYSRNEDIRTNLHVKSRCFTKYIEEKFPQWKLERYVANRYPYDYNNPGDMNTSHSNFYFYSLQ